MAHLACCPVWNASRRRSAVTLGCALIAAACSAEPAATNDDIAVVRARPSSASSAPAPVATVAEIAPAATPYPTRPRRAFVDPPLRSSLIDPPGLIPLPPPPPPEAFGGARSAPIPSTDPARSPGT